MKKVPGYIFPNIPGRWTHEERGFALALRGLFDQLFQRNTKVVDDLASTSATDALSANQGRVLNNRTSHFYRQGGQSPGGSTNNITFTAQEENTHCVLCYAANMSHVFCNSLTNNTVYSDGIADGFTLTKNGATYTLTRNTTTVFMWTVLWI